jgi:hypothetical protein
MKTNFICPICQKPNEIFIDELAWDEKLETIYECEHCGNDAILKAAILAFSKESNNRSQTEYAKRLKITGGDVQENLDYKVTGLELQQEERMCIADSLNLKLCNTCCFSGGCKTEQNIKDKYHLLNCGCSFHLDYIEKFNLEFEISKELKQKEQKKEHNFLAIVKGNDVPNNWKNTTIKGDIIMGSAMRNTTNEIDDLLNQLGIDEDDKETLEKVVECAVAILSNNTKFISESER